LNQQPGINNRQLKNEEKTQSGRGGSQETRKIAERKVGDIVEAKKSQKKMLWNGSNAQASTVVGYVYKRMRWKKETNLYSRPRSKTIYLHQKSTNIE